MSKNLNPKIRQIFRSRFKSFCHQGVIKGYQSMLAKPSEYKEWKEEKISSRLLYEMKRLPFLKSKNIIVAREYHLEDEAILFGEKEASEADRIDFSFSNTWKQKEYSEYFGEAKNLSHKSWTKKKGVKVKAWDQRDYFIQTGIQGLLSGKYSKLEGFLIGYIVNGTAKDCVIGVNKLISTKKLPPLVGLIKTKKGICEYPNCYSSENSKDGKSSLLQHIFLEFDN